MTEKEEELQKECDEDNKHLNREGRRLSHWEVRGGTKCLVEE